MIDIKTILEPFDLSVGKKQDLLTMLIHVRNSKVSMNDLINYLEDLKKKQIEQVNRAEQSIKHREKIALKCPECNTPMHLFPVNTQPGDQTGDDSKSMWICSKCWHEEYSIETIEELFKREGTNGL